VQGAILTRYNQLGGAGGTLGTCTTNELPTPDGVGRFNHFRKGTTLGSIYWTPATGANEVHGIIRAKWEQLGWEQGVLGYPTTDELPTPDGVGRFNHFQRGSIYWTQATGAHAVYGAIHQTWKELGWEQGVLGYPVTDEYAVPGGSESEFQKGFLTYNAATGTVSRRMK
jgi:uncharacterized protein with LGFP repeats